MLQNVALSKHFMAWKLVHMFWALGSGITLSKSLVLMGQIPFSIPEKLLVVSSRPWLNHEQIQLNSVINLLNWPSCCHRKINRTLADIIALPSAFLKITSASWSLPSINLHAMISNFFSDFFTILWLILVVQWKRTVWAGWIAERILILVFSSSSSRSCSGFSNILCASGVMIGVYLEYTQFTKRLCNKSSSLHTSIMFTTAW